VVDFIDDTHFRTSAALEQTMNGKMHGEKVTIFSKVTFFCLWTAARHDSNRRQKDLNSLWERSP